jgi:hypothetical protein
MIAFEVKKLLTVKDRFEELSVIARDAVGLEPARTLQELNNYANRGVDIILMTQGDTLIGYLLFGKAEIFINWSKNLPLRLRLVKEKALNIYCLSHIHVLKNYWKKGLTAAMAVEYCKAIYDQGGEYLLIWGAATEELAQYGLKKPGSKVLEGIKDSRGHTVGIRDLKIFLEQEGRL